MNSKLKNSENVSKTDFSFTKSYRLRKRGDFKRVSSHGKRLFSRYCCVHYSPRPKATQPPRLGITVTKKYGKAHDRNAFKRMAREAFRHLELPPIDLNVRPTKSHQEIPLSLLQADIQTALNKVASSL